MSKLKEIMGALIAALRYSFSFCIRNDRKDSIARIILAVLGAIVAYVTVWSIGALMNVVQVIATGARRIQDPRDLIGSELVSPTMMLMITLVMGVIVNRYAWYYKNRWNHRLRIANQKELNDHRATLDIARFRSKQFDDLVKRIQELPASWQTRIWFADEMLNLFALTASFVIFGSALLVHWKTYALVLAISSLPMIFAKTRIITAWWTLFQDLVPHHKKRGVLEKPYNNVVSFAQALMFHQMPILRKEIDENTNDVIGRYDEIRRMTMKGETVTNLISVLGLCGVLVHAIWMTVVSGSGIGTLAILIASARAFQSSFEGMVGLVVDQWNNVRGILLLERDFFGLKAAVQTIDPVVPHFKGPPAIRLDRVCFVYPEKDTLVLRNISLSIESGSKVCVVGKSGSGKTSLVGLLLRQYDPTSGNVFVGDLNLRNITPASWTEFASALGQDYAILERPIGQEIASSRMGEEIDPEAVEEAARFAHFHQVVNSDPEGYESQIGTEFGGREFSGGEKHRLALARVAYRKTPILILDEPDSKLDPETAQKMIDNVFALKGVTVILITHQVSRAERGDKVIVLEKGELIEQGTHAELMAIAGGAYVRMFKEDKKRIGRDE